MIKGVARIVSVFDRWYWRPHRRFKSPMFAPFPVLRQRGLGPGCALVDPGAQKSNLFRRERIAFLWHSSQVFFGPCHRLEQKALCALSSNEQRARIASFERRLFFVQTQTTFLLLRSVTFVA